MHASLTDRELIRAYRNGEDRAFETLLNRYQQGVFTKIHFVVRDEEIANDLFQEHKNNDQNKKTKDKHNKTHERNITNDTKSTTHTHTQ